MNFPFKEASRGQRIAYTDMWLKNELATSPANLVKQKPNDPRIDTLLTAYHGDLVHVDNKIATIRFVSNILSVVLTGSSLALEIVDPSIQQAVIGGGLILGAVFGMFAQFVFPLSGLGEKFARVDTVTAMRRGLRPPNER